MTEKAAHTTFIVATDRDALILEKLAALEEGMQGLVPLLAKIITQMESQAVKPTPPIATYEDLYALADPGPPEGELVLAAQLQQAARPVRWWERVIRGPA